jgi:hypothetical protein
MEGDTGCDSMASQKWLDHEGYDLINVLIHWTTHNMHRLLGGVEYGVHI